MYPNPIDFPLSLTLYLFGMYFMWYEMFSFFKSMPYFFSHQIEEEFRDYIPAYIDMLHEVDKMDDCLEVNSSPNQYFAPNVNSFNKQMYKRVLVLW